jgi:G:T-mismatch repair DNA endonuclease (very short patch repair protein)
MLQKIEMDEGWRIAYLWECALGEDAEDELVGRIGA